MTLSSYVVVIVDGDGDGDVAVDDCSACQMQLLHESPCSAFRSSTCTAVRSSSLDWPLLLPKRFQEGTPRCLISCAAQQVRYPSTLLKRLAVPGRQMPHLPTPSLAGLRWSACAAVLDALFVLKAVDATTKQRGDDLLERIVGMLTRLCR